MRTLRLSLLLLLTAAPAAAQTADRPSFSLAGRHAIAIGVGMTASQTATTGPLGSATSSDGLGASLSYTHWVGRQWSLEVSVEELAAESAAGPVHGASNLSVSPLLLGVGYYPEALALTSRLRPYASLAAGAFVRSQTSAGPGGTGSSSEAVVGARAGLGIDWFPTRFLRLGAQALHHTLPEFDSAPGQDYGGTSFVLVGGVMIGRGR